MTLEAGELSVDELKDRLGSEGVEELQMFLREKGCDEGDPQLIVMLLEDLVDPDPFYVDLKAISAIRSDRNDHSLVDEFRRIDDGSVIPGTGAMTKLMAVYAHIIGSYVPYAQDWQEAANAFKWDVRRQELTPR